MNLRRLFVAALASAALIGPLAIAPSSVAAATGTAPEVASFPTGITRLAGASRYDTAVSVSQRYAPGVDAVFVATGQNFPDALSAAAAAAQLGGPLLLTPSASLPAKVRQEIVRLKPRTIYVVGGTGAVAPAVATSLQTIAPTTRLGGATRYETGNNVVARAFASATHAFIATGSTFPDALAATGAAGSLSAPVILVDGSRPALPPSTITLLDRLGVSSVTVVGGSGAVSDGILTHLQTRYQTQRIGGSGRYETAAKVNDVFFPTGSAPAVFLATGLNFPDALAGAALAGRLTSPVYITTAACVPEVARTSRQRIGAASTVVLGGAAVVSDNAARNIGCLTPGAPRVLGTAKVTYRLTAQVGTWTAGTSFRYQWLANGTAISGATSSTLLLSTGMAGKQISVRVTGSKAGYLTASATSGKTAKVVYPGRTVPIDSWNCPSWAPIKGNASSMIYHVPGGAYYARTNPEECFRTETDARNAGYRKSKL
ncbi:cell wall-binding repeat-containing protein [Microbacterium sp. NPDC057659]|uniref:cell wall-binding repeat-containing protein n=1 Tax=Microbacterium sp. NPDC057659 TaxID=3346198 RepID=UPI0036726F03